MPSTAAPDVTTAETAAGSASPSGDAASPSGSIVRDGNGVYHWVYELHLMKNPVVFGTVFKIFAVLILIEAVFVAVLGLADGSSFMETVTGAGQMGLIMLVLFFVLTLVGYTLYAAMNGWKYCVLFEMDDEGVTHTQLPRQFKKAQVLGALTSLVGAASGKVGVVGTGILAASRNSMSTTFANVRSVKVSNTWHYLKINEPLAKNQVYAEEEDFPFVRDFILAHVPA